MKAWELIGFANTIIRIPLEISKTDEYRTIDIQPLLAAWLKPYAKRKVALFGKEFDRDYKAAGRSSTGSEGKSGSRLTTPGGAGRSVTGRTCNRVRFLWASAEL